MPEPLITRYRPSTFEEVLGHDDQVNALKRVLKTDTRPHAYLLTGPSGIGKTTIARIIATAIDAEVLEIDAASNSGIDAVRQLNELGQHMSLYGADARMFIIDECHGLSRPAMQALLKLLEDPPEHLYLALATTELQRIPETILTRCYHIPLRPIKPTEIEDLLSVICECENWTPNPDVLQMIVQGSTGQPRKALSLLQACYDAPSREEAKRIIALLETSEPLLDLLRILVSGRRDWKLVQSYLEQIDDADFEEASVGAGRYIINAMLKEPEEKKAASMWALLEALVYPTATFDRKASFFAAIGRYLWTKM